MRVFPEPPSVKYVLPQQPQESHQNHERDRTRVGPRRSSTPGATRRSRWRCCSSRGPSGRAAVPSGASTGSFEAVELRDGDDRYGGKGVRQRGRPCQRRDRRRDRRHGGRSTNGASTSPSSTSTGPTTRPGSGPTPSSASPWPWPRPRPTRSGLPLFRYVGGTGAHVLPVPMMNVLNGGVHADNNVDIQEFMVVPVGAASWSEALRWGTETYHALQGGPPRARPVDGDRRRRRLRARPAVQRGCRQSPARGHRPGRAGPRDRGGGGHRRGVQRVLPRRPLPAGRRRPVPRRGRVRRLPHRPGRPLSRSCRSRTVWPRMTGTAGPS